jgi:hypothetical protein
MSTGLCTGTSPCRRSLAGWQLAVGAADSRRFVEGAGMRPMVRPGLHLLRRDIRTLQVGLEWPGVAALVDSSAVQAVLEAVDGFRDLPGVILAAEARGVSGQAAHEAVGALLDSGALVDQATVKPSDVESAGWAAMWLLAGPGCTAADVHRVRQTARVYVEGSGRVADQVRALVVAEGLAPASSAEEASVLVLAADHEPSRQSADEALRRGVPYLCVGIRELVGLVGPFVVPGRTACLRCVDLSRAHTDPCWRTLVDAIQANPAAEPCRTPSLVATIAGYAVQEVVTWASGAIPVSCDNVVEVPLGLGLVQTVCYPLHPQCGCGWQSGRETMSA